MPVGFSSGQLTTITTTFSDIAGVAASQVTGIFIAALPLLWTLFVLALVIGFVRGFISWRP